MQKVVFFGTSDYCIPILESLNLNFELVLVATRPDKPVGRKGILTPSATKLWAEKNNIKVVTPETLKKNTPDRLSLSKEIKKARPFLAVVSDYGLIIPEKIFNLPKFGTINIHFSKLPDLRGPSPVQFTLLRGDKEAWITIFKLENPPELEIKMDSGPILFQRSYPINPDDTTATLYTRLFIEVSKQVSQVISKYIAGTGSMVNQDHSKSTFCRFLTKDNGFIEWQTLEKAARGEQLAVSELPKIQQEALTIVPVIARSESDAAIRGKKTTDRHASLAMTIYDFYRGLTPWPGMWTHYPTTSNQQPATKRMKILKCHLEGKKLVLDEVQFEGKNPIVWNDS